MFKEKPIFENKNNFLEEITILKVSAIRSQKTSEKNQHFARTKYIWKEIKHMESSKRFWERDQHNNNIGKALEISSKMHNAKSERPHMATC
jgi:hypothetical protein